jgi:hypothetical protein
VHIHQAAASVVSRRRARALVIAALGSSRGPRGRLAGERLVPLSSSYQPVLVLLSSGRGIWCGLGGSSVRVPLTCTGPHTRTHSVPIKHVVPPLTHPHSMSNSTCTQHEQRTCAHLAQRAQHTRLDKNRGGKKEVVNT